MYNYMENWIFFIFEIRTGLSFENYWCKYVNPWCIGFKINVFDDSYKVTSLKNCRCSMECCFDLKFEAFEENKLCNAYLIFAYIYCCYNFNQYRQIFWDHGLSQKYPWFIYRLECTSFDMSMINQFYTYYMAFNTIIPLFFPKLWLFSRHSPQSFYIKMFIVILQLVNVPSCVPNSNQPSFSHISPFLTSHIWGQLVFPLGIISTHLAIKRDILIIINFSSIYPCCLIFSHLCMFLFVLPVHLVVHWLTYLLWLPLPKQSSNYIKNIFLYFWPHSLILTLFSFILHHSLITSIAIFILISLQVHQSVLEASHSLPTTAPYPI